MRALSNDEQLAILNQDVCGEWAIWRTIGYLLPTIQKQYQKPQKWGKKMSLLWFNPLSIPGAWRLWPYSFCWQRSGTAQEGNFPDWDMIEQTIRARQMNIHKHSKSLPRKRTIDLLSVLTCITWAAKTYKKTVVVHKWKLLNPSCCPSATCCNNQHYLLQVT